MLGFFSCARQGLSLCNPSKVFWYVGCILWLILRLGDPKMQPTLELLSFLFIYFFPLLHPSPPSSQVHSSWQVFNHSIYLFIYLLYFCIELKVLSSLFNRLCTILHPLPDLWTVKIVHKRLNKLLYVPAPGVLPFGCQCAGAIVKPLFYCIYSKSLSWQCFWIANIYLTGK